MCATVSSTSSLQPFWDPFISCRQTNSLEFTAWSSARSSCWLGTTDLYKVPDAIPPIHAESYHVATDKVPSIDGGKFQSILATIYNQSQLAQRKHVARYWSINTAATAVPLSPHPSAVTKLAAAIFGGPLFGGGALPAQYCPCGVYGRRPTYTRVDGRTRARCEWALSVDSCGLNVMPE